MLDTMPSIWQLLMVLVFFLAFLGVFTYFNMRWIAHRRMKLVSEAFKEVVFDEHGIVISDEAAWRLARNAVWGPSYEEAQMRRGREKLEKAELLLKESGKYDVQRRSPTTTPRDADTGVT